MQVGNEPVDLASQLGVGLEFHVLLVEVMIRLGLQEVPLPALADQDKRGQEDRFQRHDQRQRRPWLRLDEQHPDGEHRDVQVDEPHRPREPGDPISDPQLKVCSPFRLLFQDDRVAPDLAPLRSTPVTSALSRLVPGASGVSRLLRRLWLCLRAV